MFKSNITSTTTTTSNTPATNREITNAIIDDNLDELKKLVKSNNVNIIVDRRNKFTALHLAIIFGKQSLIQYLIMDCGASTSILTADGKDSAQLADDHGCGKAFLNAVLKDVEKKNENSISEASFLKIDVNRLKREVDILEGKVKSLDTQNSSLNARNSELKQAYQNLEKDFEKEKIEHKSLKRKFDEMDSNEDVKDLKEENERLKKSVDTFRKLMKK